MWNTFLADTNSFRAAGQTEHETEEVVWCHLVQLRALAQ